MGFVDIVREGPVLKLLKMKMEASTFSRLGIPAGPAAVEQLPAQHLEDDLMRGPRRKIGSGDGNTTLAILVRAGQTRLFPGIINTLLSVLTD